MATTTNVKKDADAVLALGLQAALEITLMVPSEARTLCGLTILVPDARGVPAKKCVFGGLIDIDGEWYGLVARHPFQDSAAFRQPSICVSGLKNEVIEERLDDEDSSQAPITNCVSLKVQVLVPSTVDAREAATKDFDWALLDLSQLQNTDIWAKVLMLNRVDDHVIRRIDDQHWCFEGQVSVVCGENRSIPGYLHPLSVSRDFRGSSFDVRSVFLERPSRELKFQFFY